MRFRTPSGKTKGVYLLIDPAASAIIAKEDAQPWINHDQPQSDAQKKLPAYYEWWLPCHPPERTERALKHLVTSQIGGSR